jgi:hypothetical protein
VCAGMGSEHKKCRIRHMLAAAAAHEKSWRAAFATAHESASDLNAIAIVC